MARIRYREKLAMIYAVQYDGTNLAALEEFAPGKIVVQNGDVFIHQASPVYIPVRVTEWLIDDPYVGYICTITDAAFKSRFDPTPQAA